MSLKKTENGLAFPADAFLLVLDPAIPSTWKLRTWSTPEGEITAESLARVATALGGYRGSQLTVEERTASLAKLRETYATQKIAPVASILQEAYLSGTYVSAAKDGEASFEARLAAVQYALRQRHTTLHSDLSPHSYDCSMAPLATFVASVVYEMMGKTFEVSYTMTGTTAVIGMDDEEITFTPTPRIMSEAREEDVFEVRPSGVVLSEATVGDDGIIRNTVLITATSSNGAGGREYSEKALRQIAQLSEGLPAYANHVKDKAEAFKPRDVKDIIGRHKNVRFDAGKQRVTSDLHVLESHRDWVLPLAREMGDVIGNSVVSRAVLRNNGTKEIIESIVAVRSGDLVSDPATTRGLFEHREHGGRAPSAPSQEGEIMNTTEILKYLRENPTESLVVTEALAKPRIDEAAAAHAAALVAKDAQIKTLSEERDGLKTKTEAQAVELTESKVKNDGFEAAAATTAKAGRLAKVLADSDLTKKHGKNTEAVSEKFRGLLMESAEDRWVDLITDRVKTLDAAVAQAGERRPTSFSKDTVQESVEGNRLPANAHDRIRSALTRV